ncbi:c-type cytochrome [Fibrella forsythiae]|uniref:Cytochrome c n=1 Tax=Fibrella forsythiae TaxID=2817061 RepID=A0ABS3JNE3_9BACT|nr:cytochrome c [Fibrella forsythiae]MBO0951514.1 cytochrome c [Fibrella forsythiae]
MIRSKVAITILLISSVCCSLAAQSKKPAGTTPAKSQTVAAAQPGLAIYKQYCLTCHQVDGGGVPNMNPPLRGTDWVNGDKARLIGVLLKGLKDAEVEGEPYDNVMPAHDFLTDQQIADVLTFIRSNFGNKATAISAQDVNQQRGK